MKRDFYRVLEDWQKNDIEIPLMIVGARQVGKTYIIDEFCKNNFDDYIYINLKDNKEVCNIFKEEEDSKCGIEIERDINASINIMYEGIISYYKGIIQI